MGLFARGAWACLAVGLAGGVACWWGGRGPGCWWGLAYGVGLLVGWPYGMWPGLAVGLAAGGLVYSLSPNAFSLRDPVPWAAGVLGWRGLVA